MARIRLIRPLFSDQASGNMSAVGCFRTTSTGVAQLSVVMPGNSDPSGMDSVEREGFGLCAKQYADLPRSWVEAGGVWRKLADISWPDFASRWFNALSRWAPGHAAALLEQGGDSLSSGIDSLVSPYVFAHHAIADVCSSSAFSASVSALSEPDAVADTCASSPVPAGFPSMSAPGAAADACASSPVPAGLSSVSAPGAVADGLISSAASS